MLLRQKRQRSPFSNSESCVQEERGIRISEQSAEENVAEQWQLTTNLDSCGV